MTAAYSTVRELDPYHITVGAGFAANKAQYTDSAHNPACPAEYCGHAMDELPKLPSITCTAAQGAGQPKPCEARYADACDRGKNPSGRGCCVSCGPLSKIIPVTALSLDVVMIENYSPEPDTHAKVLHMLCLLLRWILLGQIPSCISYAGGLH